MRKVLTVIDKSICVILTVLLVFMVGVLLLSVFFRYVLNSPLFWIDEVVRYPFVWLTFLGMGHAVKKHKHIVVDFINVLISAKMVKVLDICVNCVIFGFSIVLIYYGIVVSADQLAVRSAIFSWLSYGYLYAAIPIGCIVGLAYLVREFLLNIKELKDPNLGKGEISK